MSKNNHSSGSVLADGGLYLNSVRVEPVELAVRGEPVEPPVRGELVEPYLNEHSAGSVSDVRAVRQTHRERRNDWSRDRGCERKSDSGRERRNDWDPDCRHERRRDRRSDRGLEWRTHRSFTFGALAFVLASHTSFAQLSGNPAGLSPDTPGIESATPANSHANTQDKLFVRQIALGNRAEVELGKLAQSKGSAAAVKDFATRMQKDHSTSLDRAMKAGRAAKMDIPKDLDAEHQRVRDELNALSGVDFDKAYLTAQIQDHQKTANLLLWQLSYGQNAELLKYSAETLPHVLDHLEHAKREYAKLTETPPPP